AEADGSGCQVRRTSAEAGAGNCQTLPGTAPRAHQKRRAGNARPGRRTIEQGDRLFRRSFGHFGGSDPAGKPFPAVRRLREIEGAGRAHARFPGAGDEPGSEYDRLEGERQFDLARGRHVEGGVGKVPRTGAERRVMNGQSRESKAGGKASPLLIVISAPSGGGKTTLSQQLIATNPNVTRVVTCTTRPPREGERDGVDYYILDEAAFQKRVQAGEFLEFATVYAHRYGSTKSE